MYPEKRVKVIFVEEEGVLVTVTVLSRFGKWSRVAE
jgi:hypothetical protein